MTTKYEKTLAERQEKLQNLRNRWEELKEEHGGRRSVHKNQLQHARMKIRKAGRQIDRNGWSVNIAEAEAVMDAIETTSNMKM